MTREEFQPNLKALRRILAALIAAAVVTFGIALFLILHAPPRLNVTRASRKCTCAGAGICCLRPSPSAKAGK